MRIERVDPLDLDLDLADAVTEMARASLDRAGLTLLPAPTGPTWLVSTQVRHEMRPVAVQLLAHDSSERLVGHAQVEMPSRDNTDSAHVTVLVHPDARRNGAGQALLSECLSACAEAGRTRITAGCWQGSDGEPFLRANGFSSRGLGINAVRRIDLHATPSSHWHELYAAAATAAGDYELVRMVGATPPDRLDDMAALHAAINDAPQSDPASEPDIWDAARVQDYDRAMAARRQTVYRVIVRHRASGEWVGISMLCVDEFAPRIAFQEDTSVVRAHRGHRLGLLMKADMLRWITDARPEVGATDTWNDTTNHHMIAVNETLGAHVIARHIGFRLDR